MPFEKSVLVPLNADETFALITQPDRLRRWQVVTARVDLRDGGDYRWTVIPGNSAAGTFTEVEPGRRVVFTWGWEGSADLPLSTVTITLEPAAGGTTVHLTHEGLTSEQEASHAEGWTHYLGRLVTAATAGDAGPDEWAARPALDPLSSAEATLAICQLVLCGVAEGDYHKPTVCTEFDVTQLADHLIGSVTYFGAAAGAAADPIPARTPACSSPSPAAPSTPRGNQLCQNAPHTPRAPRAGWTCRPPTRPRPRRSTPGCSAGPTTTSPWTRGRSTRWPCSAATRSPRSPRSRPPWRAPRPCGTPTSPSTRSTRPQPRSRPRVARSRWRRSTSWTPGGCPSSWTRPVPRSRCGRPASTSAPRW